MERALRVFERGVIYAAQVLLALVIAAALVQLWYLFIVALREHVGDITTVPMLTLAVQRAFAGVLLVVLGLELLETLRVYFTHHRVRLEIILVVAIIAIGRHIINLDLEHVEGATLAGIAALIAALAAGYYLVRRTGDAGKD